MKTLTVHRLVVLIAVAIAFAGCAGMRDADTTQQDHVAANPPATSMSIPF